MCERERILINNNMLFSDVGNSTNETRRVIAFDAALLGCIPYVMRNVFFLDMPCPPNECATQITEKAVLWLLFKLQINTNI